MTHDLLLVEDGPAWFAVRGADVLAVETCRPHDVHLAEAAGFARSSSWPGPRRTIVLAAGRFAAHQIGAIVHCDDDDILTMPATVGRCAPQVRGLIQTTTITALWLDSSRLDSATLHTSPGAP